MRVVFAGTPEAAVPSLELLVGSRHEVVAVLTRPDAPTGRGKRMSRSPVAGFADDAGLPVLQPTGLRDPGFVADLAGLQPDACPVVAYGALVPPPALAIPRHGWINLHFSLLPAWRGAAPVQHAIWHGDDITGATTFRLEEGLDTGPVFGTMVEPLGSRDTAGEVLQRLSVSGAHLLVATLDGIEAGRLAPQPQPADGVSLAPKITVSDARIDWGQPAAAIERQIRACTPAPGAWSTLRGDRVKIFPGTPADREPAAPGSLVMAGRNAWAVGTGTVPLLLGEVQAAGKRRMAAADWLRGVRDLGDESLQ
jgi:methionyl-tRNA formyltransferase